HWRGEYRRNPDRVYAEPGERMLHDVRGRVDAESRYAEAQPIVQYSLDFIANILFCKVERRLKVIEAVVIVSPRPLVVGPDAFFLSGKNRPLAWLDGRRMLAPDVVAAIARL